MCKEQVRIRSSSTGLTPSAGLRHRLGFFFNRFDSGYRPGLKIPTGAWRRIQLQLKDKSICERAASGNLGPSRSEGLFASRQALAKVPRSSHQAAPDTVNQND
ncbi:hypothetical protein MTO96_000520 [Rhipicephalus appendiculatus]